MQLLGNGISILEYVPEMSSASRSRTCSMGSAFLRAAGPATSERTPANLAHYLPKDPQELRSTPLHNVTLGTFHSELLVAPFRNGQLAAGTRERRPPVVFHLVLRPPSDPAPLAYSPTHTSFHFKKPLVAYAHIAIEIIHRVNWLSSKSQCDPTSPPPLRSRSPQRSTRTSQSRILQLSVPSGTKVRAAHLAAASHPTSQLTGPPTSMLVATPSPPSLLTRRARGCTV
jgi:hypothetical protein